MGGEMMPNLIDELKSMVKYDPETGLFTWLVETNRYGGKSCIGDVAGTPKDGYIQIGVKGRHYRGHRLAWFLMTGAFPSNGFEIDHINGVRSDNRWGNLRLVTRSQNNTNAGPRRDSTSGHRGVSWRSERQKWHARIYINKKPRILGDFDSLSDAIAARERAEDEHYRGFVRR